MTTFFLVAGTWRVLCSLEYHWLGTYRLGGPQWRWKESKR
jgi:hypothetical protein